MSPIEAGSDDDKRWPLWTAVLDGRPFAIVKARDEADALELAGNIAKFLPAPAGGELGVRQPTDAERRHYADRSRQLPPGVGAVALP